MRGLSLLLSGLMLGLAPASGLTAETEAPEGVLGDHWQGSPLQGKRSRGPVLSGEFQQEWRDGARDPLTGEADALLASRSMVWVGRNPRSRWRVGLGMEQLRPGLGAYPLAPQAQIWGGLRLQVSGELSWSLETPLWVRDESRRSGLRFERPGKEGIASLRNALRYRLSSDSELVIKPRRSKFSVTYTAAW